MPSTSGSVTKKQIFLNVAILDAPAGIAAMKGIAPPKISHFKALVDTGATGTCISPRVAAMVGLKPIGKIPIRGVSGLLCVNYYFFYLGLTISSGPLGAPDPSQFEADIHILRTPIEGAELNSGAAFDVLLGMDVIANGDLHIRGGAWSWEW